MLVLFYRGKTTASYPVYVLHKPIAGFISPIFKKVPLSAPLTGVLFVIILIAISLFIEKFYDIPLRRKLTSIIFKG